MFKKEIDSTVSFIKDKGVILYPTDTVWGLGCDATNDFAVEKIYKLKERSESKSLIVLVDSIEMLKLYVGNIPDAIFSILHENKRPTTIIYHSPKGFSKKCCCQG